MNDGVKQTLEEPVLALDQTLVQPPALQLASQVLGLATHRIELTEHLTPRAERLIQTLQLPGDCALPLGQLAQTLHDQRAQVRPVDAGRLRVELALLLRQLCQLFECLLHSGTRLC